MDLPLPPKDSWVNTHSWNYMQVNFLTEIDIGRPSQAKNPNVQEMNKYSDNNRILITIYPKLVQLVVSMILISEKKNLLQTAHL